MISRIPKNLVQKNYTRNSIKKKIFWDEISLLTVPLLPLSGLFYLLQLGMKLVGQTIANKKKHLINIPIVVVGNITVGGTGKTPLVMYLANELYKIGYKPGVISRGFGRENSEILEVSTNASPKTVGDEPLMIKRRLNFCPVFVGPDKTEAIMALIQKYPNTNLIISDDGLQHYALNRDVEICVVDGDRKFGNGLLIPAGPLRQPQTRISEVDITVIKNGSDSSFTESGKCFFMSYVPMDFRNIKNPKKYESVENWHNKEFFAVAGIGNPYNFFELLEKNNLKFQHRIFPDHHKFMETDLNFVGDSPVLMTEKDAIKCSSFARANWWMLRVEVIIDPEIIESIQKKIEKINECQVA